MQMGNIACSDIRLARLKKVALAMFVYMKEWTFLKLLQVSHLDVLALDFTGP